MRIHHDSDVDAACRTLVGKLGAAGWPRHAIGGTAYGGVSDLIDTRAICLIRETLARHSGLADFAFAMQGLGSGAITLYGTEEQKRAYLPRAASGEAIAAFALSEPDAGSDVAALSCAAREDGDAYVLNGEKTWISNGGIADFYVVFARTGEGEGSRGISAFIVDAGVPGFDHRRAYRSDRAASARRGSGSRTAAFRNRGCSAPPARVSRSPCATSTSSARPSRRRRSASRGARSTRHSTRATTRGMFRQTLADFQLTQAKLAQMATAVDASALLTYRAAWLRDQGKTVTREAAMAKLTATEEAQRVIDAAVQMWGGLGLVSGQPVEQLYREIRALRIYEGASEVQQLIVARELLREAKASQAAASVR